MTRDRIFSILWRFAILALPWQARWIFSLPASQAGVPNINGFPWEQGTAAIYVSWIVMVAAILIAGHGRASRNGAMEQWSMNRTAPLLHRSTIVAACLLLIVSLFTSSVQATLLWWSHIILLVAFAVALIHRRVPAASIALWFIISLIPHAALGLWQFWSQHVAGSTIFGIAPQLPADSGVSVVETSQYRILRAYGGFPHPNIFGAWLAAGLTVIMMMVSRHDNAPHRGASTGWRSFGLVICSVLFTAALVLTFSRGAWLAAAVGIITSLLIVSRLRSFSNGAMEQWSNGRIAPLLHCSIVAITAIVVTTWQWPAVATRFNPTARLESWSISQRTSAIQDGLAAWRAHPYLGWGPGAGLIGISVTRTTPSPVPLEPPHLVPLVILLETGIIGAVAILLLIGYLIRYLAIQRRLLRALPALGVLSVLALTDHSLWTLWAGQALVMIFALFLIKRPEFAPS